VAVVETLELDIARALEAVSNLGDRLTEVAEAFADELSSALESALTSLPIIEPAVDTDPIVEALDEALTDVPDVVPEGDGSQVAAALDDAVDVDREAVVDGDATAVTAAGDDAVAAIDGTVELEADGSGVTDELQGAIDAVDTTVELEVTVDTGQVEDQLSGLTVELDGLGGSAQSVTNDFDGLSGAAGFGGAAGAMRAFGGAATAATAGAAGVVGVAVGAYGALSSLAETARENVETTQNWERTLGETGARILDLESGTTGFATDLRQLAQDMGTSDEALMQTVQSFATFRTITGDTSDEVVGMSQDLVALSAQIVATNPNLGTMDEVVRKLERGLVTGGRMVQQFGLNMSSADIEAQALSMGLADTADNLSRADLQAAGLALALQQLPPDYEAVRRAQDTVAISARSVSERWGDLQEEIGKPLVEPVDALREAAVSLAEGVGSSVIPMMEDFADILGVIADAAGFAARNIPTLVDALGGLGGIARTLPGPLGTAVTILDGLGSIVRSNKQDVDDSVPTLGRFEEANVRAAATSASGWADFFQSQAADLAAAEEWSAAYFAGVDAQITGFVSSVQSHIPNVTAEFQKLGQDGMGVEEVLTSLDEMFAATETWTDQMSAQIEAGNTNIVGLMSALGPEKSAIIDGMNAEELTKLEGHLRKLATIEQNARVAARVVAVEQWGLAQGLNETQTKELVDRYEKNLILADPMASELEAVAAEIRDETATAEEAGALAGRAVNGMRTPLDEDTSVPAAAKGVMERAVSEADGVATSQTNAIGQNFSSGIQTGIVSRLSNVVQAATSVMSAAIVAANTEARNSSPSKVMIEAGRNLSDGLAIGIADRKQSVVAEAEAIMAAALAPRSGDVRVGALGGNVMPEQVSVNVQVPVTVAGPVGSDAGRQFGESAGVEIGRQVRLSLRAEGLVA